MDYAPPLSASYRNALLKAKEVAAEKKITIYLVPPSESEDANGQWSISRFSRSEREEYQKTRTTEVSKLKPRSSFVYISPFADETPQEKEMREWRDEQEAEYRRLWIHDNPGLQELYYPSAYPNTIGPAYD